MSEDSALQKSVLAKLAWEPTTAAALIGVRARNNVVILSSHVDSSLQKNAAEDAAQQVERAKDVAEKLGVHLACDSASGDDDIAIAADIRLVLDAAVPNHFVQIEGERLGRFDRDYSMALRGGGGGIRHLSCGQRHRLLRPGHDPAEREHTRYLRQRHGCSAPFRVLRPKGMVTVAAEGGAMCDCREPPNC